MSKTAAKPPKTFDAVTRSGQPMVKAVTGAVRAASTGKGRPDLIPAYPIKRLAVHYENGALVHADRNWEKGLPLHRFLESAERHILDFKDGERGEDHLAAVLWNIAGYIWTEREIAYGRLPEELRDVPWEDSMDHGARPEEG